jgi:hypothetical protein
LECEDRLDPTRFPAKFFWLLPWPYMDCSDATVDRVPAYSLVEALAAAAAARSTDEALRTE